MFDWVDSVLDWFAQKIEVFQLWLLDCLHDFIIWIVNLAFDFCDWFIGIFSELFESVFSTIGDNAVTDKCMEIFGIIDLFFPVDTFFLCVTVFCSFCLSIWVIRRIIKFIPFVG